MMNLNNAKAGIRKYLGSASDFFGRLDKKKKILFISGAVIVGDDHVLIVFAESPVLFLSIPSSMPRMHAITQYLKDKKIPFELKDEGARFCPRTAEMPGQTDLANENLPKGKVVGFESFDQLRFGETKARRR